VTTSPAFELMKIREAEIKKLRDELAFELQEVQAAMDAIKGVRAHREAEQALTRLTIKEMIISVLASHREGGTADQIIGWIIKSHNTEVARPSLSPQLSRLKAGGEISLNEETNKWRLQPHMFFANQDAREQIKNLESRGRMLDRMTGERGYRHKK